MARYFFDAQADPPARDENGKDFDSVAEAKEHAHQVALLLTGGPGAHRMSEDVEVVVRDEGGEVFRVKVSPRREMP